MNPFQTGSKRRLIAVDHGTRVVKLLLVEPHGEGLRVIDRKQVDLQDEGLLAPEEIRRHLFHLAHEWGEWPMAVTLPARLSFSQVVDLPPGAGERDIPKVIEEQTGRLQGLSGSPLVYDATRLEPYGKLPHPYFLTIAREADVDQHLTRTTEEVNEIRDVSGLANALLSAHRVFQPALRDCVLVDWGDSESVAVAVRGGQGIFASAFAMGSRLLVEAVSHASKRSATEAEARLRAENLLSGPAKLPALCAAVDAWVAALRKVVGECRQENPVFWPEGESITVVLSGGVLRQPGLLEYLQMQSGFRFTLWPEAQQNGTVVPLSDLAVACGAALEAFRRPLDAPSLLPPALRSHAQHLRRMAGLNIAGLMVILLTALLLTGATWRKSSLIAAKQELTQQAETAFAEVQKLERLTRQRDQVFEQSWPLLDQQERGFDLLYALRVLQQARAQHDYWCVLLADSESYARGSTQSPVITNSFGLTNAPAVEWPPAKPTFIVELCVPAKGEQTLKILSDVVTELRKDPLLGRVDSVPAAQRRTLADAKVIIPDRHFAVSVDFADRGWRALFQTLRPADARGATNQIRRPGLSPTGRPRIGPGPSPSPSTSNGVYE